MKKLFVPASVAVLAISFSKPAFKQKQGETYYQRKCRQDKAWIYKQQQLHQMGFIVEDDLVKLIQKDDVWLQNCAKRLLISKFCSDKHKEELQPLYDKMLSKHKLTPEERRSVYSICINYIGKLTFCANKLVEEGVGRFIDGKKWVKNK